MHNILVWHYIKKSSTYYTNLGHSPVHSYSVANTLRGNRITMYITAQGTTAFDSN